MPGKRLSDYVAAIDPSALIGGSVTTSDITEGTTLTATTLNEAMESLMASPSYFDSQYAMRYGMMSRQEAMERERYEHEKMMRQRQMVQYDPRTMEYKPYGYDDDRSAREIEMLKAELHATKKAAEVQKAQRAKSRESLIAHYYSMRPAGVKA